MYFNIFLFWIENSFEYFGWKKFKISEIFWKTDIPATTEKKGQKQNLPGD